MTLLLLILIAIIIYYFFIYKDYQTVKIDKGIYNKCPNCSSEIQKNFNVCPICKETLRKECSKCGNKINLRWNYCPYCETKIGSGDNE